MSDNIEHTSARAELEPLLARAITNAEAMNAEHGRYRAAQASYAALLALAAAGEDVREAEFEAAEDALATARRRVGRRVAIAGIQARAVQALIPAARAEAEFTAAAEIIKAAADEGATK